MILHEHDYGRDLFFSRNRKDSELSPVGLLGHLQRKQQVLINTTDAGGQTEDQDGFSHPNVDRFQGASEPQWRTRKQETSQAENPLSISVVKRQERNVHVFSSLQFLLFVGTITSQ